MDIKRAKQALIAADAAGDTQAAQTLAQFIRSQETQAPVKSQPTKPSLGRTIFEQGLQGLTAGFEENVTDPLAATIAATIQEPRSLITGEVESPALAEELANLEQTTQNRLAAQREQRPIASVLSNIGGSLATGLAAGTTKAGATLGNLLRSGGATARIAKGSLAGGIGGGLYGAGMAEDDWQRGATEGAISGALVGGAIPAVGAAARGLVPSVDEGLKLVAQKAQKHKIPLSIDQITDSRSLKNLQKLSQEFPLSGQEAFRDKQMKAFNRALLKTVGQEGDTFSRARIDKAFMDVGHKFDKIGKGKTFESAPLQSAIAEILDDAPTFATDDAVKVATKNAEKVLQELQSGTIKGEKLNLFRSRINAAARKTNMPDAKELLKDLENAVVETLAQGDSQLVREAKQQYKNLLVLEPLLSKVKGGDIRPTLLTNRVNRIYGRSFVRGNAGEIGDLADIGRELLPELGGSDTAQKMLYAAGAGAAAVNPATTVPVLSGLGLNRAAQSFINRNQNIIARMTKEQQQELMALPVSEAQKLLDAIKSTATRSPVFLGE